MLTLTPLPYSYDALEPYISRDTLRTHYEGHHAGYVNKFNQLFSENSNDVSTLNFNYNGDLLHRLYWESLSPKQHLRSKLRSLIIKQYGTLENFLDQLITSCGSHQGSGWTLLLQTPLDRLMIKNIPNHDFHAIGDQYNILIVLDAWEHAYYLDYKNDKKKFFNSILSIIDWEAAENRLI